MKVLVTVGTTSFDELVEAVDSSPVREVLAACNYAEVVCQIGKGLVQPTHSTFFTYSDQFEELVAEADLIICHAGAGSILSGVRKNKKVIAVVNKRLMDNHQQELASAMADLGHILCCAGPEHLAATVSAS